MLPVVQLEGQRGRAGRARRKLLAKRMRGYGVWLTLACAHFEWIVLSALGILGYLFIPAGADTPDFEWRELVQYLGAASSSTDVALYALAVSIIEPFYVCAGFSLYLNRRATLEGWDIELALRRLGERLRAVARIAAVVVLVALGMQYAPESYAKETPKEAVAEVLKAPEFQTEKEEMRWVPRKQEKEEGNAWEPPEWLLNLLTFFSDIGQIAAWAGVGIIVALLIYAALRLRIPKSDPIPGYVPPDALFGMDLRPESLPDDIAGAALELAQQNRLREALSLLYRGALSHLVHRSRLAFAAGDTEEDCLRTASRALDGNVMRYFTSLVGAWRRIAYGYDAPGAPEVQALCRDWSAHFPKEATA